jgi:hypothetical protein
MGLQLTMETGSPSDIQTRSIWKETSLRREKQPTMLVSKKMRTELPKGNKNSLETGLKKRL